jgi:hypothetical protein
MHPPKRLQEAALENFGPGIASESTWVLGASMRS